VDCIEQGFWGCISRSVSLASINTMRNLGVIFDQNLSFDAHIEQLSRTAFFHLRNIAKFRNILFQSDAEKLLHAFVTGLLQFFIIGFSKKNL